MTSMADNAEVPYVYCAIIARKKIHGKNALRERIWSNDGNHCKNALRENIAYQNIAKLNIFSYWHFADHQGVADIQCNLHSCSKNSMQNKWVLPYCANAFLPHFFNVGWGSGTPIH